MIGRFIRKTNIAFFALSVLALQAGCYRRPSGDDVLARVGDAVLTRNEALRMIDTSFGNIDEQLRRYTAAWVNHELIYQEAKRHGIESSLDFQEKILNMKRELLIQEFLRRFLYSDTSKISDDQLRQYYAEHQKEFFVREQVIKVNMIGFRTREHASAFGASIARGMMWDTAVAAIKNRSPLNQEIIAEVSQRYVSQTTLFPEELWKVARTLNIQEPSYPVRTTDGYFIIQVLEQHQPGDTATYELVRDEVKERFLVEQTRRRYEELLGTLRKKTTVDVKFSTTTDTTQTTTE